MMGLPAGWVTDPDIWEGLTDKNGKPLTGDRLKSATRNAQLKMLGNGVHPLQVTVALHHLMQVSQTGYGELSPAHQ